MTTETAKLLGPFPESPRVVYAQNPLVEVVCEVRFPPILRIAAEPPVAFQERVRSEYPILRERNPEIGAPQGIPPAVLQMVKGIASQQRQLGYEFISKDDTWKVLLTRESLSLTATNYRRWEVFRKQLEGPLEALIAVYSPPFFLRVGLRYQDLIRRSRLGFSTTASWSQLLKPHMLGILASPEVEGSVAASVTQAIIGFPQFAGKLKLNYGVVQAADTKEDSFLIDGDFYTEERIDAHGLDEVLSYFNRQSGRLFRWCIEERLHKAMEPQSVEALA